MVNALSFLALGLNLGGVILGLAFNMELSRRIACLETSTNAADVFLERLERDMKEIRSVARAFYESPPPQESFRESLRREVNRLKSDAENAFRDEVENRRPTGAWGEDVHGTTTGTRCMVCGILCFTVSLFVFVISTQPIAVWIPVIATSSCLLLVFLGYNGIRLYNPYTAMDVSP